MSRAWKNLELHSAVNHNDIKVYGGEHAGMSGPRAGVVEAEVEGFSASEAASPASDNSV